MILHYELKRELRLSIGDEALCLVKYTWVVIFRE